MEKMCEIFWEKVSNRRADVFKTPSVGSATCRCSLHVNELISPMFISVQIEDSKSGFYFSLCC